MFVRKKKNKSGTTSIQIVDKSSGSFRVVKSVGSSDDEGEINALFRKASLQLSSLVNQMEFDFVHGTDKIIHDALKNDTTAYIEVSGPEKILGKIFNQIGFSVITEPLFKDLVLSRLICPFSKLKTSEFLGIYKKGAIDVSKIYRFMDRFHNQYIILCQDISFAYTKNVLGNDTSLVFYDMTTLYFETEQEDELRKKGFSKDGKPQNPQILMGLLVGKHGYPMGFELFDGKTFEGHTLVPVLKRFEQRYNLPQPIVVADSGLLSKQNIEMLAANGYRYILGARIKNETASIKNQIMGFNFNTGAILEIKKEENCRLIVTYKHNRAEKDAHNRRQGLERLEKKLKSGHLTKQNLNNKGYNKFLNLKGNIKISIDYDKLELDSRWDGLKGYITNCELSTGAVIENYQQLWQIEKAFRVSKNDLKVRPVYHRLQRRIETHITISFCAYTIYKELERQLRLKKSQLSPQKAIELCQSMYTLYITLPESKKQMGIDLPLSDDQRKLIKILE